MPHVQRLGIKSDNMLWRAKQPEADPYQLEWQDLLDAIRNDKPYNEVKRGVEASLVSSMGRMAAHTGQEVLWDEILNSDHEFAPDVAKLTLDSPRRCWPTPAASIPSPCRESKRPGSIDRQSSSGPPLSKAI